MKLLSIVWFNVFPAKFGGQKGIAAFEEALTKSFDVTCICSRDNVAEASVIPLLPILPTGKLQFLNPFVIYKILRQVKLQKPDVLLLEHPYHAIAGILAKRWFDIKLILHEHNIEYVRFKQLGKWWWRILRWIEKIANKAADAVLFKTCEDRDLAVNTFKINQAKTFIIPYCITEHKFLPVKPTCIYSRHNIPEDHKIILFAGTLDYKPNADAVEGIFLNLAPLLAAQQYTIIITGRNVLPQFSYLYQLKHPNVVIAGEVENMEEYFYTADVFINPVLSGGGIQTKVLDALSYHCLVVAFEKGLTGIDRTTTNKTYAVANGDWEGFADAIKSAIEIEKTPTEASFYATYNWENALAPVIEALTKKITLTQQLNTPNFQSKKNENAA